MTRFSSMSRRNFLGTAIAGGVLEAYGSSLRSTVVITERWPNILFILADDLGYSDLSLDSQTAYQTPNLDQLAKEGIRDSSVPVPSQSMLIPKGYGLYNALGNV